MLIIIQNAMYQIFRYSRKRINKVSSLFLIILIEFQAPVKDVTKL